MQHIIYISISPIGVNEFAPVTKKYGPVNRKLQVKFSNALLLEKNHYGPRQTATKYDTNLETRVSPSVSKVNALYHKVT